MPIWLGGKVRQGGDGINPNHWEWSDGTKWDYTHWGTGEPNGRQTGEISRLSLVELIASLSLVETFIALLSHKEPAQ